MGQHGQQDARGRQQIGPAHCVGDDFSVDRKNRKNHAGHHGSRIRCSKVSTQAGDQQTDQGMQQDIDQQLRQRR